MICIAYFLSFLGSSMLKNPHCHYPVIVAVVVVVVVGGGGGGGGGGGVCVLILVTMSDL